ncbi:hypothetical protein [Wenyingzhuangia sp. IMCC45467]
MKLYEKIILITIAVTGLLIGMSTLFDFNLFPFISLIPFGLFLILLTSYTFKITDRKKKFLLLTYIFISLIDTLFSFLHWEGQMFLGSTKWLIILILSIYWLIDINKLNIETYNKKVKWISILFLTFIISHYIFINISLFVFIGLFVLVVKLLKNDNSLLEKNDYQMVKIALLTSVFFISIHLKAILLLSMII